jgi:hypothetical protein
MTDSDYQNNKDPQLDKALEVIESQITAQWPNYESDFINWCPQIGEKAWH